MRTLLSAGVRNWTLWLDSLRLVVILLLPTEKKTDDWTHDEIRNRNWLGKRWPGSPFLCGKAGFGGTWSSAAGNTTNADVAAAILDFVVTDICSLLFDRSLKCMYELLFVCSSVKIDLNERTWKNFWELFLATVVYFKRDSIWRNVGRLVGSYAQQSCNRSNRRFGQ